MSVETPKNVSSTVTRNDSADESHWTLNFTNNDENLTTAALFRNSPITFQSTDSEKMVTYSRLKDHKDSSPEVKDFKNARELASKEPGTVCDSIMSQETFSCKTEREESCNDYASL